jgi:hypothetical protein
MPLNHGVTMVPPSGERRPVVLVIVAIIAIAVLAFVVGYFVF